MRVSPSPGVIAAATVPLLLVAAFGRRSAGRASISEAMTEAHTAAPSFDGAFRDAFHELLLWRRDVRRFAADDVDRTTLDHLFELASLSPSVGLSQPWRFVIVETPQLRIAVRNCFERCNAEALQDYTGERAAQYARLKLAGLDEAPRQFAVFADMATEQGRGLGRRTMPQTIEYSAVMAVHTLWLAARAQGIGLGWVSIIDPAEMANILQVPASWKFIGYFCLGYPAATATVPELERLGWEQRRSAVVLTM